MCAADIRHLNLGICLTIISRLLSIYRHLSVAKISQIALHLHVADHFPATCFLNDSNR